MKTVTERGREGGVEIEKKNKNEVRRAERKKEGRNERREKVGPGLVLSVLKL